MRYSRRTCIGRRIGMLILVAMPWVCVPPSRAAGSEGETVRVTLESRIFGTERGLRVVLPPDHGAGDEGLPVIIVLDGEHNTAYVSAIVTFLQRAGAMPPSVVVGVENAQRERDMTPPGMKIPWMPEPGGDRFLDYLDKEVVPKIGSMARLSGLNVIVGHSHGGIFAAWAVAERPERFQIALALDVPWHLDDTYLIDRLVERCRAKPDEPLRLVVGEARFPCVDAPWSRLVDAAPRDSTLIKFRLEDETHETMGFQGTYRGLKEAFRAYANARPDEHSPEGIKQMCARLSRTLGGPISPTPKIYEDAARACLLDARSDDARAILGLWVRTFGQGERTELYAAEIDVCAAHGPLVETVSQIVASPRPSVEDIRPYLGTWKCALTFPENRGGRSNSSIEFTIREGRLEASSYEKFPDGGELRRDAVVVRFRDGALQFGFMNGMHPRGVLLFTVTPDNPASPTRLAGTHDMAGVWFNWSEAGGPPTADVVMTREPGPIKDVPGS